jgi:hypothetical protein
MPVAGLLVLLGLWPQAVSANEAKFRITATWIINYVEPKARSVLTRRSYTVTLKRDGTVTERLERTTGNGWAGSTLLELDKELGEVGGKRRSTTWKVVNETTLVRLVARESHTFAIWLRTQGTDSCTATLEWRLKPGFTLFEAPTKPNRPQIRFAEPSWPNARCDVL